jgi:hypothetical protein
VLVGGANDVIKLIESGELKGNPPAPPA